MLHAIVLTMTSVYFALALITIFVSIIYIKIYSFNSFMKENTLRSERYKKDPEKE